MHALLTGARTAQPAPLHTRHEYSFTFAHLCKHVLTSASPLANALQTVTGDISTFDVSGTTYAPQGAVADERGAPVSEPAQHPCLLNAALCRCASSARLDAVWRPVRLWGPVRLCLPHAPWPGCSQRLSGLAVPVSLSQAPNPTPPC